MSRNAEKVIVREGDQWYRFTAIYETEPSGRGQRCVWCKCSCGSKRIVELKNLRNGNTKSCGCLQKDKATTHGMSKHRLYPVWKQMVARCHNPNNRGYKSYGGRAIHPVKVCEEWHDFRKFLAWNTSLPKAEQWREGLEIDRRRNSRGYNPENCWWQNDPQQVRNRRVTILIIYRDQLVPLADVYDLLVEKHGALVTYKQFAKRHHNWGWSLRDSFTVASSHVGRSLPGEEAESFKQFYERNQSMANVSYGCASRRIKSGQTWQQAISNPDKRKLPTDDANRHLRSRNRSPTTPSEDST